MIKPIVKDVFFLGQKSEPAAKQDLSVGQDLWRKHREAYFGWKAQIIQHECDHLEGIII